jgi:xanthine dehydrogenase accessory factor
VTLPFLNQASRPLVLVRGAGEHATGTAHRLFRAGFTVVMTEIARPLAVRRTVAFAEAVFEGACTVEDVIARRIDIAPDSLARADLPPGTIAILIDPELRSLAALRPEILVDARLKKREIETHASDAPLVIGLGPGFVAGLHADLVIETNRGHDLGRVITSGAAEPDTGVPGEIAGHTAQRVFRAPRAGRFVSTHAIGELLAAGETIGAVGGEPVAVSIDGILRGLLRTGLEIEAGAKLGDVDPRARREHCFSLTDKTRAISGGVLEAILAWMNAAR